MYEGFKHEPAPGSKFQELSVAQATHTFLFSQGRRSHSILVWLSELSRIFIVTDVGMVSLSNPFSSISPFLIDSETLICPFQINRSSSTMAVR